MSRENNRAGSYHKSKNVFSAGNIKIISNSKEMRQVIYMVKKVASTGSNVLIIGESGTGKELIAQALHILSSRARNEFVAINCAAIPSELLESELFGHERGAFTSAHKRRIGKFEFADKGTLFLDEVSNLRLDLQAKLLRAIQEYEFHRLGDHRCVKVNVRIIAATNVCLKELVKKKYFREDLFYRLYVVPIELPPLRTRKEDVECLAHYFLDRFNNRFERNIKGITPKAMNALRDYKWPGNIRELENLIERIVVLKNNENPIDVKNLPMNIIEGTDFLEIDKDKGLISARHAFERDYIVKALRRCLWNQSKTAQLLNIHRNTLKKKMQAFNIRFQTSEFI